VHGADVDAFVEAPVGRWQVAPLVTGTVAGTAADMFVTEPQLRVVSLHVDMLDTNPKGVDDSERQADKPTDAEKCRQEAPCRDATLCAVN
jgi:hypothetical protein